MGTSKRRKKRERLHRNVSSLKVFFTNLQCLFNLWTGYSTPPCAEMVQLSPAAKAACGICPTWTPSCRTNSSGGAPKRSRTAFGTRQDTVLDRYDLFNCCCYNVKYFFQAAIPGTYPDNSIRMSRYYDVLGIPLIHL